jgi:hypothetical protein
MTQLRLHLTYPLSSLFLASYTCFAAILCQQMNENSRVGKRIGQLGLKLLNQSSSFMNELPLVHMLYYGYVGKTL